MPYDYIEEYQKQNDETIWLFRDKDAQEKIDTSSTETDYTNPLSLETMQAQLAENTKIKIEPIQDFHGYDKPWVGGAGVNLAGITKSAYSTSGISITPEYDSNGNFIDLKIIADGTKATETFYWVTDNDPGVWTPFLNKTLKAYTWGMTTGLQFELCYKVNSSDILAYGCRYANTDADGTLTITFGSSYYTLGYRVRVAANTVVNTTLRMMIVESSAIVTSFSSYTNICPISSHDQIDILGCGKNLCDLDSVRIGIAWNDSHNSDRATVLTPILGTATYTLKVNAPNNMFDGNQFYIVQKDANNVVVSTGLSIANNTAYTFTAEQTATLFIVQFNKTNITKTDFANTTIQLEIGSEATEYVPYAGQSNNLSIDLPSTVYGGVLDLESGELVVGWKYKVFTGTEQWRVANSMFYTEIIDSKYSGKGSLIGYDCYCSHYKSAGDKTWNHFTNGDINIGSDTNGSDRPYVNIKDTRYTDVESFKTAINGVQLVYELSTPFTLYISPEHLKLLKAQNNLTTSQYTQVKVTYRNGVFATLEELSDTANGIYEEISGDATTVSGNPINFTTREKQKSKSTIIDLEPIQDLHGFTKPWVGGAGKNLLPLTVDGIKARNSGMTWNGNSTIFNNVTFTILTDSDNNVIGIKVNGTAQNANANLHLPIPSINLSGHILNGCPSGGGTSTYYIRIEAPTSTYFNDYGSGATITNNGALVGCWIGVPVGGSANNLIFKPMLRLSTVTDATFEPYTNIASISGRTSVDIDGCGKNLYIGSPSFDGYDNRNNWTKDTASYNGHEIIYKQSAWGGVQKGILLSAGTYVFSSSAKASESCICQLVIGDGVSVIFATQQMIVSTSWEKYFISFTLTSQQIVYAKIESKENKMLYISEYQLEQDDHATPYEPYTPSTDLTISFGTTVYGGRLDVENGILVMDRKYKLYDGSSDEEWAYSSGWSKTNTNVFFSDIVIEDAYFPFYDVVSITNCNYFEGFSRNRLYEIDTNGVSLSGSTSQGKITIRILKSTASSLEDFKTWIASNNIEIVYILNTPTTLQLTPQQVQLLKGINNISTTGTTITVTFKNGSVAHLDDLPENAFTDLDKEKLASIDTLLNALGLSVVDGKLCQTYNT